MAVTNDTPIEGNNSNSASYSISGITIDPEVNHLVCIISGAGVDHATAGVTGVTFGGEAMAKTYDNPTFEVPLGGADVYELHNPPTGSGLTLTVTRAAGGYAPICVALIPLRGVDDDTPNDGWTRTSVASPNGSPYTRTVDIDSDAGDLTLSFCNAVTAFTQCEITAGFQTQIATEADADSRELRVGAQAGTGGTVTHSYDLDADAGGRVAYIYSTNFNAAASGGGPDPDPGEFIDALAFPLVYNL